MKPKRSLTSMACELATVLSVTTTVFLWGKQAAQIERGYDAYGGEYILLLIPFLYYIGKRVLLDWIADLRELKKGRHYEYER